MPVVSSVIAMLVVPVMLMSVGIVMSVMSVVTAMSVVPVMSMMSVVIAMSVVSRSSDLILPWDGQSAGETDLMCTNCPTAFWSCSCKGRVAMDTRRSGLL